VRAKPAVTVRLVHVPDSKPVAGAVLFETKSDMGPSGMAEMAGKVSPLPSDQPGLYRFQIENGMAGKWQLALGAKVQGEGRHRARYRRLRGEVTMLRQTLPTTSGAAFCVVASDAGDHAFGGTGLRRCAGLPRSARRHAR